MLSAYPLANRGVMPVPKSYYDKTIRTINEVKSLSSHMVALGKIRVDSEDLHLVHLINHLLVALHYYHQQSGSKTTPVPLALVPIQETQNVLTYCMTYKVQKKPEWQVVAERHGWRPPVSRV
jgi:hypothetical protein